MPKLLHCATMISLKVRALGVSPSRPNTTVSTPTCDLLAPATPLKRTCEERDYKGLHAVSF